MPSFQYQSLTTSGEARNGVLTANDRADAVRRLLDRGETATSVEAAGGAAAKAAARLAAAPVAKKKTGRPNLKRPELANFIRELATALEAGLPLMAALKTVRRQAHGRAMPAILDHLIERVEAGDPLYRAAETYGRPFDDMVVGMMRAADASGEMNQILHQLADLLDRSVELRRELMGATMYPMIVATLLLGSVIILVTVLVPKLIAPMAQNANFTMPWPTKVVLAMASFFQTSWPFIIAGIVGIVMLWRLWTALPANRLRVDRFLLRTPVLGRLLRDVAVARFTRTLGTLSTSGLSILESLKITRDTLGNTALMSAIDEVQEQVTSGRPLADPLERSGLFPPLLIQVVNLGERSGRLDQMLMHAASAFDRQVNASVKLFTKALPPLLLIVMATVGVFVLAAILLPMLELQSALG